MAKIYVSSTYLDLQDYRTQVERVIRRMGHEDVAMEYYVAEDQRPVDRCLSDVAACDLYIGIFAWRYGWIPKKNNRKKLSITEMEYRQAQKTGKPCLIFLLDGKAPWPPDFIDDDKTQIKRLRNELGEKHSTGPGFKSVDELGRLVAEAIHKWEKEHGYIPIASSIPEYNLDAYYQALRKRYQTLALEGLTPPQKEEYLQIHLRSVFVEQNVRESPPPVELPKEVWEKLQRDRDVHPEDLPSGITFDDVRRAREIYFEKQPRPVLEVLTDARHQQAIILGDPGSGKSTLARYIMLSLIDPSTALGAGPSTQLKAGPADDEKLRDKFNGYLPLLIELRTYTGACLEGNCGTFLEFLEYLGKTEGWHLTQAALHHHLKNDGRAVVIFDGLDEIFDPEKREQITRQIVGFANDYSKPRIIVTSRILGYRQKILTDAGFTHFTLQDLDEKQVETFVNHWYDLALSDRPDEAKERQERILKSFKESASIRQLAGNPMLLTIMAIIGKHQELPRERWKLYDHAASVLIQHWDVNKHLRDQRVEADFIGEDDKKELLRRLAFKMQGAEGGLAGNYIHRDQLQNEFESYLIERYSQATDRAKVIAEMMIQQFRERNFILSLYGANLYGFVHRAFLEYFCASAFVWKFEKTKELTIEQLKTDIYGKHWEDQSWHDVLRLICGMIDAKWAEKIIDYLFNMSYQEPTNLDNFISDEEIEIVIRRAYNQSSNQPMLPGSHRKVSLSAACLGEMNNILTIEKLANNFSMHVNWKVRYDIMTVLVERFRYNSRTLEILNEYAINDLCEYIREAAVSAKAEYLQNDMQTLPILLDRAINDICDSVRRAAVWALAERYRDDAHTLPLLHDRAVNDTSPNPSDKDYVINSYIRYVAISTIAKHWPSHSDTLPLLKDRAKNDPTPWLRKRAKELIKELTEKKK